MKKIVYFLLFALCLPIGLIDDWSSISRRLVAELSFGAGNWLG